VAAARAGAATQSPTVRRFPVPSLLREQPQFRRLWTGQTISLLGDQVTLLALPLVAVVLLHATAAQMGYLTAAALLPNLLFSLHAGVWADRHGHRRRAMVAADLGRAALLVTIPAAWALGRLTLVQLYVVGFLTGTCSVLFFVSYNTLFVAVTPRERFVEGNSLIYGSRAFSFVVGKSLGGFLVQLFSAPGALLADAASFLASGLCLGRIRAAEPPPDREPRGNLRAGGRWIWRSPVVRASLAATATVNFFNFVFMALFILYATRALQLRPAVLGAVLGVGSVGSVLGSLVTGRLTRRFGIGPMCLLGYVLFPAPFLLVPLAGPGGGRLLVLGLLCAFQFGAGVGIMVLDITEGAILAAALPDRLRARVSGAYLAVNYGVRPLGALAGGALGSTIGLRPTLWVAAAGGVTSVLWLLGSPIPRLRTLPDLDPDPDPDTESQPDS
jgi:MFS family permease